MVIVEHLSKNYGKHAAVRDISFAVQPGEIFGFLGVNGAGKTTTLRMLAGVLRPSGGRIAIGGNDIISAATQAKRITGYIPDRPHLYTKLTAGEFLAFVCDLYEVPEERTEQRVSSLLAAYGLSEWRNELIESFSHGMRQRLATCAALVHEPKLLIVDEPMVGLDPHGAKLLKEALRNYASAGMAIILSTHSLNVAEELSDRLAIIHGGSFIAEGTFSQLKQLSRSGQDRLEQIFLELTTPQAAA